MTNSNNGNTDGRFNRRIVAAVVAGIVLIVGAVLLWPRGDVKSPPAPVEVAGTPSADAGNTLGATAEVSIATAPTTNASTAGTPIIDESKSAPGPGETAEPDGTKLVDEAREMIGRKEFADAVGRLDDAIKLNPRLADAYALRGRAHELRGKLTEALADFQRAEELTTNEPPAAGGANLADVWEWRGEVHLQQTNGVAAIKEFSKAIARIPVSSATEPTTGRDSTNTISVAVAEHAVDRPYVLRGYAYLIAGQPTNALPDLDYWIKRHDTDPLGYFYRGQVHVALDEPDLALADFSQAIELDKNYLGAWEFRGGVHYRKGEYQAALGDFQAALEVSDKSEYAARMGGRSAFNLGRLPLAIELFGRSLELNPTNAVVYENRGSAYAQLEQWSKALADYTSAARYEPGAGRLHFYRANFQICLGQLDQALSTAEVALGCADLDPQQRQYLIILTVLGKPLDATARQRLRLAAVPVKGGWPAPVIKYLRGEMDYAAALQAAGTDGERDELRTYAGWNELNTGKIEDGRAHLNQMIREGDRKLFEYHLALLLSPPSEPGSGSAK